MLRGQQTRYIHAVLLHRQTPTGLILATNACRALHRHYDLYPTATDNTLAEVTIVNALINAYTRG
jgi:hypothetical protein